MPVSLFLAIFSLTMPADNLSLLALFELSPDGFLFNGDLPDKHFVVNY